MQTPGQYEISTERSRLDLAPIHRSAVVRDFVTGTSGRLVVERLPAYAPELNPVE